MLVMMVSMVFGLHLVYGVNLQNSPLTVLWQIIQVANGELAWSSVSTLGALTTTVWAAGTGIAVAGLFVSQRLLYTGLAINLLSWAGVIYEVYSRMSQEVDAGFLGGDMVLLNMILVFYVLTWVFILIEWVRGRDQ